MVSPASYSRKHALVVGIILLYCYASITQAPPEPLSTILIPQQQQQQHDSIRVIIAADDSQHTTRSNSNRSVAATSSSVNKNKNFADDDLNSNNNKEERCALCFFGLPRAFQAMVLPSIIQNILVPNAKHNCDVFVHFYDQQEEVKGRKNRGGKLDTSQIYALEQAVKDVQQKWQQQQPSSGTGMRGPTVRFVSDTEASFWEKRGTQIERYQTTKTAEGKPAFFPYEAKSYTNASMINIVKQWHSIDAAFELMERNALLVGSGTYNVNINYYTRVGMFRSDVMFMTPIDITHLGGNDEGGGGLEVEADKDDRHVVVPGFAQMPVNDRMVYGPYEAVKIWSTQRFDLMELRAKNQDDPGRTFHSEQFLYQSIFPAMEAQGYLMNTNYDICFLRTRADESAMLSDCRVVKVRNRGWKEQNKELIENMVQKNCTDLFNMGRKWTFTGCGKGVKYPVGKTTR